jgi:hypothetical protein
VSSIGSPPAPLSSSIPPPSSGLSIGARAVIAMVVVVVLLLSVLSLGLLPGLNLFVTRPAAVQLQVVVSPNAIPVSGTWNVTTFLYYSNNSTRFAVDATVTMKAVLRDATRNVVTKRTTAGSASFSVPANTVAVTFDASEANYSGSTAVSGPVVVPWLTGELEVIPAIPMGLGLGGASWRLTRESTSLRRRLSLSVPELGVSFPPTAFVVATYPAWFGTGWIPAYALGFPIWGFSLAALIVGGITTGLSYYERKGPPPRPPVNDSNVPSIG